MSDAVQPEANPPSSRPDVGSPYTIESMEHRMVFLISPPRSGSTLLMRILNATSTIYSRPESHLIPALAHLGFWDTVEKAPYDQLQAQTATRDFVADLPERDDDYYAACRAYLDVLFGRMFAAHRAEGEAFFLEKTPANALVLPFLARVYPNAHYIVLTRHPAAIFASYANSFFDGDYQAAVDFNPILSRYVPVMANALREKPCPIEHVAYEDVASQPEAVLRRISAFLGTEYEPDAVNYKKADVAKGLGDPIGVEKHDRPVTSSIEKWAPELAADDEKFDIVARQLASVPPEDLSTWGYPVETLWAPMEQADPASWKAKKKTWDRHALQRRALVLMRRDIHKKPLGEWVKKTRFYCDVLLRG